MKTHYERSIDVEAPVHVTFACWERFRDFPRFVEAVEEVELVAPGRTHWRLQLLPGLEREWTAEITERIPARRIAWRSREGPPHAGCVTFHRLDERTTRVMLQVDYLPDGLLDAAGDILRVPQLLLDAALRGFKAWVEGGEAKRECATARSPGQPAAAPASGAPCPSRAPAA